MFKLSAYIAKLEDRWGKKLGRLWEKHKGKWKLYLPLGLSAWYFYGMLINSIRLGTRATFNQTGEAVDSIWVVNPFRNRKPADSVRPRPCRPPDTECGCRGAPPGHHGSP